MEQAELNKELRHHALPDTRRSIIQTSITLGMYLISVTLMTLLLYFQVKSVYWSHSKEWDRYRASMEGSSFYTMPGLLRWSTGNIGYHHIHHLAPRIPNYKLKECFDEIPALQEIKPIPYLRGFRNLCLSLWDEKSGHLISFREARQNNAAV